MEVKLLITIFGVFSAIDILGYKSKDENQMDSLHRLVTINGCLHKLLVKDMPRLCKDFKIKEEIQPHLDAAENYLTCRETAGSFSKCSEVQEEDQWGCNRSLMRLQVVNTMKAVCRSQHNTKEQSYITRTRSIRGLKHLIGDVHQIYKEMEKEINGEVEPFVIRDEKTWRDGIYRRFKQTELLTKQWVVELNLLRPKNENLHKRFTNLISRLRDWFDRVSTRTNTVPRGEVRGTLVQDIKEMRRHNRRLIERLKTVYIDEYIESDGQEAWMSASQNIERVLVVPLEIQDVLDDLVKFIQRVDIWVVGVSDQSGERLRSFPDIHQKYPWLGKFLDIYKESAIHRFYVWLMPPWKTFLVMIFYSFLLAIAQTVINYLVERFLPTIKIGTKKVSSKGAPAEQKLPDTHTRGTVTAFFSR